LEERASIIKLLGLPETFAVVLLTFSFILTLAPYFSGADFGLFKIPRFTDFARKKLKLIGPIVFLVLVTLFVHMIPQRVSINSNNANRSDNNNNRSDANPNTITILVANFRGPDPQNYLVTDKIIQGLRAATGAYSDISIQPLEETITEQRGGRSGSEYARDVGAKRNASIVLWGYYGATSETVNVSVYFEVLRKPKLLSLRQNLETQTLPISDLNGFKIQTRLSGEMTYLVLLTVGLARYESGDYDAAIDRFTKAIAQSNAPGQIIDPADIYFYRGSAYYFKDGANWVDHSFADFDEAIKRKPDLAAAYVNRGVTYDEKDQYDLAIADYDKAIKINPDDAQTYYNRAIVYSEKGERERAIADYNTAIKLKPDFAKAYNNRGRIYADKGQYDLAIADYNTAIKLKPDFAKPYYNRGYVYGKKGQDELALTDFNEAIKLEPDFAAAYVNRGVAYAKKGQHDRAIADFDTAIKLKPDLADAYVNRAIAYRDKGEFDRAIADLKYVLQITNDSNIRQRVEQVLQELGVK
jgi:tetratricopeptide (TPR) repeat protein/uncharacterized membrane protein YhdT